MKKKEYYDVRNTSIPSDDGLVPSFGICRSLVSNVLYHEVNKKLLTDWGLPYEVSYMIVEQYNMKEYSLKIRRILDIENQIRDIEQAGPSSGVTNDDARKKKEKIDKLLKLNINSIIIICGAHHKYKKYTNSSMYIDMIIDLFKEYGIDSKLSLKNNPDKDLLLGVAAENFINTGGGFSKLIKEIRIKDGKLPTL